MTYVIRNTVLFFASAVLFGLLEGGGHVTFGPPTLWILVANWHLPMFGLVLILAYSLKCVVHIPAWMLVEDIAFWIFTGRALEALSWVSMGMGGFVLFGQYLPWTYVLLLGLWGVFVSLRGTYKLIEGRFNV